MNKKTLVAFTGGTFAGIAMIAGSFAYQGNPGQENPNPIDQERHENVQSMIEAKDYESFQELFENRGPARFIDSQEDFEKWLDMKEAYEAGDSEQASSFADELGLGQRNGGGQGAKQGRRGVRNEDCLMADDEGSFERTVGQGNGQKGGQGQGRGMRR